MAFFVEHRPYLSQAQRNTHSDTPIRTYYPGRSYVPAVPASRAKDPELLRLREAARFAGSHFGTRSPQYAEAILKFQDALNPHIRK